MPRIESGSSSLGETWQVPYKAIGLVLLISCGIGYAAYQYVRLNPKPKRPVARQQVASAAVDKRLADIEKLALRDDQKEKLKALASTTTNPVALRREANKLLTPEQKAQAKNLRAEAQAKRKEQIEKRKERTQKYFPNGQVAIAEAKAKEIQARAQQRRKATQTATAAPKL